MIEIVLLSIALSREPVRCSTREEEQIIRFDSSINETRIADTKFLRAVVTTSTDQKAVLVTDFSSQENYAQLSIVDRFRQLAAKWSEETSHMSSVTRAIAQPSYQAIIKLGWDAVPLMLQDLRKDKGFWYPALNAITGIRPFDPKDAGNSRRMTQAWVNWGHKKGLI